MRRGDQALLGEQRIVRRNPLGLENIDDRLPQSSPAEAPAASAIVVDDGAARGVEEVRRRLHRPLGSRLRRGSAVESRSGTCTETKSALRRSSSSGTGSAPATGRAPEPRGSWARTSMSSPRALRASVCPIAPKPTIPSVRPATRRVGSPVARLQSPIRRRTVIGHHAARKRERIASTCSATSSVQ